MQPPVRKSRPEKLPHRFQPGQNAVLEAPAFSHLPRRATVTIGVAHSNSTYDVVFIGSEANELAKQGYGSMATGVPEAYLRAPTVLAQSRQCAQRTLEAILQTNQRKGFDVPPFQRKYCWGIEQWSALWKDLIRAKETSLPHFLGRIMLQNCPEHLPRARDQRLTVCDGQQRLTSTILFIAAMRDISLLNSQQHASPTSNPVSSRCTEILFPHHHGAAESDSPVTLTDCILVPTFDDRAAFWQAVRCPPSSQPNPTSSVDSDMIGHDVFSTALPASIQGAHAYFTQTLQRFVSNQPADPIALLEDLLDTLLHRFEFVMFEIDPGTNDGAGANRAESAATQMLYENLAIRDAGLSRILHIARPGVTISVTDLVRNHVLSFFPTDDAMKAAHQALWLPVERCVGGTAVAVEKFLVWFLDRHMPLTGRHKMHNSTHSVDVQREYKRFCAWLHEYERSNLDPTATNPVEKALSHLFDSAHEYVAENPSPNREQLATEAGDCQAATPVEALDQEFHHPMGSLV